MSDNYQFDLPSHHKSIIKVIGVGGGGSNAVSHMHGQGIKGVEFVICNTDVQALKSSPVPSKLQIGVGLTEGLGAGANPDVGKDAALESREEIRDLLSQDTKMVFITAGMGGGTGTGAAPVIAEVARELGILTVGIVTAPFSFEGRKKTQFANNGIAGLKESCDTVLVIMNDKLREIHGNLAIRDAFSKADNVLTTAAKSIAEIITVTSEVNVDFEDVKTVMKNSGPAVMGSAEVAGEGRARRAVEDAIASPLLNNTEIKGAQKVLLSISYGEDTELTMDELTEITDYIEEKAGYEADVIFGQGVDPVLGDAIRVTLIATGFSDTDDYYAETRKKVYDLESSTPQEPVIKEEAEEPANKSLFQQRSVEFDLPKREEPTPTEEESVDTPAYESEEEYEITEVKFEGESEEPSMNLEEKRRILDAQARERKMKIQGDSSDDMNPDDFKEKLEIPAYKRKKIELKDVPHSSENEVSRYNLNDDNEIMGDNKFLHDNVD